jgi:phosphoribosyl 1,2-cyclic phosphodiesterase
MRIISLQSGSNGNCIYVEAGDVRLLFDAGISGVQAQQRLAAHDRDIRDVDAVLISHDHSDHCRCMGVLHRKFGLALHVTDKTLATARRRHRLGEIQAAGDYRSGHCLRFGDVQIQSIPTPHDAADGVLFVVDDGRHRFGILTDLGHVFDGLPAVLASLDGVLIESNYDPQLLEAGPYPEVLKARIAGPRGHLSNGQCARLLAESAGGRLQWACLGHLSEQNNAPELVLDTHRRILGRRLPLRVASRYRVSEVLEL